MDGRARSRPMTRSLRPCEGQSLAATATPEREKAGPAVKTESSVRTIAFLGNYLPRKCGIASNSLLVLRLA